MIGQAEQERMRRLKELENANAIDEDIRSIQREYATGVLDAEQQRRVSIRRTQQLGERAMRVGNSRRAIHMANTEQQRLRQLDENLKMIQDSTRMGNQRQALRLMDEEKETRIREGDTTRCRTAKDLFDRIQLETKEGWHWTQ